MLATIAVDSVQAVALDELETLCGIVREHAERLKLMTVIFVKGKQAGALEKALKIAWESVSAELD